MTQVIEMGGEKTEVFLTCYRMARSAILRAPLR